MKVLQYLVSPVGLLISHNEISTPDDKGVIMRIGSIKKLGNILCIGSTLLCGGALKASAQGIQSGLLHSAVVDGYAAIFEKKIMADGTSQEKRLALEVGTDWLNPKLSPDGKTVLATRFRRDVDTKEVVTFPVALPSAIKVIAGSSRMPCEDGSWSTDGTRIVYKEVRSHEPYSGDIVEVDRLGNNRNVITAAAIFQGHESSAPSYSRNDAGQRIAFSCFIPDGIHPRGNEQIFVVDRVTKAFTQITHGAMKHWYPAWSPLSNQIVYTLHDLGEEPGAALHLVDVTDKTDVRIDIPKQQGIGPAAEFVDPAFSPTGRLAFSVRWSSAKGTYKVFDLDPTLKILSSLVGTETVGMFGVDYFSSPGN